MIAATTGSRQATTRWHCLAARLPSPAFDLGQTIHTHIAKDGVLPGGSTVVVASVAIRVGVRTSVAGVYNCMGGL